MKIHPKKKKTNPSKFKCYEAQCPCPAHDLDVVAEDLLNLAKSKLPDHVITGVLKGDEQDIRQEAVLLAMKWYVKQWSEKPHKAESSWNAAQAICAALRYKKQDYIKRNNKEQKTIASLSAQQNHMSQDAGGKSRDEWSPAEIKTVLTRSIETALKRGLISHANATVALQVYVDGKTVTDLAKQLNRTKSAIYQHLNRVRTAIPEIIQSHNP